MDPILLTFICVALASVTILCVVMAVLAMRAGKSLDRAVRVVELIRTDVSELKDASLPVLTKTGNVLDEATDVFERVDKNLEMLSRGSEAFAGIAQDVRDLEQSVVQRLRPSIDDAMGLVNGVVKGVTTFARKLVDR